MATYPERFRIERDGVLDPASTELPSDTTVQAVIDANGFRVQVRQAVLDVAEQAMSRAVAASGPEREKLAYARQVAQQPDLVTPTIVRLLLAKFDTATTTQIFALTDEQVRTAIELLMPALSAGLDVRR